MLRYHLFMVGRLCVSEYGSADALSSPEVLWADLKVRPYIDNASELRD